MADTYVQQRVHLVWSTGRRQDFLCTEIRRILWSYCGGIIRHHRGVMFIAGGTADHIHIYAEYPKTLPLSQFVSRVKSNSSKWLRATYPQLAGFHWQSGYGAFSVACRGDEALQKYIRNQEQHHQAMTFEEEYLKLFRGHTINVDSRYVFAD